jgi:hypothetical protein
MENVGTFYGRLGYFVAFLVYFGSFGIFCCHLIYIFSFLKYFVPRKMWQRDNVTAPLSLQKGRILPPDFPVNPSDIFSAVISCFSL